MSGSPAIPQMYIWIWTIFSPWKGPFPHPTNEYLGLGRICSLKGSFSPRCLPEKPGRAILGAGVYVVDLSHWWNWVLSHCAKENVISSILDLPPLSLIEKSAAACVRSKRGLICACLFYRQLKHLLLFFCSSKESFLIPSSLFQGEFFQPLVTFV